MKKLFLVVTMLVFSVSAFAAGSLVFQNPNDNMSAEAVPYYNSNGVVIDNNSDNITYSSPVKLGQDYSIKFELSGATFADDNNYKLVYDNWSDGVPVTRINGGNNGDSHVTFLTTGEIPANTGLVLVQDATGSDNFTISPSADLTAGDKIKIGVTEVMNVGGTRIESAETGLKDFISVIQEYSIEIADKVVADIDVYDQRRSLDLNNTIDVNDNSDNLSNAITVDNVTVNRNAKATPDLKISLVDNTNNFDGIKMVDNTTDNFTMNTTTGAYELAYKGNPVSATVNVIVDNSSPLNPTTFGVSAVLDFGDSNNYRNVSASSDNFIEFDINGAQYVVPYMIRSDDQFIRINNSYSQPASVEVDLYDEAGNKVNSVSIGEVAPYGAKVFKSASDIAAKGIAAGWTPASYGYTAVFTIAAPEQNVDAVSVQRSSTGSDRVIPITK